MLIRKNVAFSHPVMSEHTGDYGSCRFLLEVDVIEAPSSTDVTVTGLLRIEDESIVSLVRDGKAALGVACVCQDTYFSRYFPVEQESFSLPFDTGSLRGRVLLQGVVASKTDGLSLTSPNIDGVFPAHARSVYGGDPIAVSEIYAFEAGMEKLAPMESIFRLVSNSNVERGSFRVDLDKQAIEIAVPEKLHSTLSVIRGTRARDVLHSSLFLPVLMNVLQQMAAGGYEDKRWHSVISAKCGSEGIDPSSGDPSDMAQRLLKGPLGRLEGIFGGDGG